MENKTLNILAHVDNSSKRILLLLFIVSQDTRNNARSFVHPIYVVWFNWSALRDQLTRDPGIRYVLADVCWVVQHAKLAVMNSSWQRPRRISFDSSDDYFRRSHRSQSLGTLSDDGSTSSRRSRKASLPAVPRTTGFSHFSFKKTPSISEEKHQNVAKMENTYRLEPKSRFPEGKVRQIMTATLASSLVSHSYDPEHSPFQAKLLSGRLTDQVKQLKIERYKLVCLVTIGSKSRQGLKLASRCLWDPEHDTFVSVTHEGPGFFAVATLYGVYFEW